LRAFKLLKTLQFRHGDTIICNCGTTIQVGSGRQGNLKEHQKSKEHATKLAAKKIPKLTSFFKPCDPVLRSNAPLPPPLQNQTSPPIIIDKPESPEQLALPVEKLPPEDMHPAH
jgi:hypothetical protein